jgi:hypothetical protein
MHFRVGLNLLHSRFLAFFACNAFPRYCGLVQKRADALLVSADPLFLDRRVQLASLAIRHGVPAIYSSRGSFAAVLALRQFSL